MNWTTPNELVLGIALMMIAPGCNPDATADPDDALDDAGEVAAQAEDRPFTLTVDEMEFGPCPEFIPEGCEAAFIQGDPEERNADVVFRFAPDTEIPKHMHTSAERLVLISGEFHIDYDGHDPVVMRTGDYAYGPAELPHTAYCAEGEECILFVAFEEPVDAIPLQGGDVPQRR